MQNKINCKKIKKIGLVVKPDIDLTKEILYLKNILAKRKVELLYLKEQNANLKICELDDLFKKSDLIISLGGDGTLISLCRKAYEYQKPILGIHAGNLGFLTNLTMEKAENFFNDFFEGKFKIETPFMLELTLQDKKNQIISKNAFNDIVFYKKSNMSMANIKVYHKEKMFNQYFGDGLIISSPAGSTAYNLSANGPIVYTLAQVFILTPICSHSLTQRPIILPKGFEFEIGAKDCTFCIDGQEKFKVNDFKNIKIGLGEKSVTFIYPNDRDYFQILKEKLNWGN
ncbi:NAD(+) kinase [Campylobacter novaezeelandiae]|uniref:NAD(+) kinase n=1 Tax=Campylobacter novaezeelandiae TaxID=2267891 RepID=UPI00103749C6|nr:NAD(+) kinase [Campylobacter novaezeelandiae]TBR78897.1 NAD(+) kinase [Campylobacter novaezeelandiae]